MIAALKTKRGKRPTKQEISSDVIDVLQNTDLAQKEGIEEIIAETGETNTPG
jgi:hypothetical protein